MTPVPAPDARCSGPGQELDRAGDQRRVRSLVDHLTGRLAMHVHRPGPEPARALARSCSSSMKCSDRSSRESTPKPDSGAIRRIWVSTRR